MNANIAIEELEKVRRKILEDNLPKEIMERLESIETAISTLKNGQQVSPRPLESDKPPSFNSIHKVVVNAIVELIHQKQRHVKTSEIYEYLEQKQIILAEPENRSKALASILYQENKRPDGRIKWIQRGVYGLK